MAQTYIIPLKPSQPQQVQVTLSNVTYILAMSWHETPDTGWFMDIQDASGNPIIAGIALVTGADYLAQYRHLGFIGKLFVDTPSNPGQVPGFDDLGVNSFLYYYAP